MIVKAAIYIESSLVTPHTSSDFINKPVKYKDIIVGKIVNAEWEDYDRLIVTMDIEGLKI